MISSGFSAFSPLQFGIARMLVGAAALVRLGGVWSGAGAVLAAALLLGIHRRYAAAGLLVADLACGASAADVPLLLLLGLFVIAPEAEAFLFRGQGGNSDAPFSGRGWRPAVWSAFVCGHFSLAASAWLPMAGFRDGPPAALAVAHLLLLALLALPPARIPSWLALGVLTLGEAILPADVRPVAFGLLALQLLTLDVHWLPVRDDARRPVLLYDGECGLCAAIVRLLLREDVAGRLRFAPLQGSAAQDYLRSRGLPTADFESLVFVPDWGRPGSLEPLLRSAGALAAADEPGGICRVFSWLRILPESWADTAYRGVARVRGVFGRPAAAFPGENPAVAARFLP